MTDGNQALLLIDPEWTPTDEQPEPPVEVLLGAWLMTPEGKPARFQPNPDYRPSTPDSPLDPVDAVLRRMADVPDATSDLPQVLAHATFGIALDERGVALVRRAPDFQSVVLVTTAYGHRERVDAPRWREVGLAQLAKALPARGVDVLLNPGARASMRVPAETIREIAAKAKS
ncbi:hypothetical protein FHX82_001785 [Amycolatopsis bartoniae]|uniref:Type VII secretion system-associated protein n=1 Tax=Amycolatopsis bartoniae TaxID=941986 RepID=A0A8H9ISC6_9PSEU|nr:type VII secretion system-associated protein [Amycolatopsis bartoniae]MBB2934765.1 hypothetical protein [Amycolatopsis bartoniae]TVS98905.1 type VII secretion system-associated protein [Amycolatopsis bartoniae]GHF44917.1 hypothetical protein GCM10017566_17410 [Amycolatopsis bartoniae]